MNKKRILLTGSAGFIGSNFVRQVVYDKHPYEVYSVDKLANTSMINNIYQHKLHEFFVADICDIHIMDKIFAYVKPDIVIHMAAESSVDKSIESSTAFAYSNMIGTQNMVNLSVKYNVGCFLYQGTDESYGALGPEDKSWTEESPLNPRNPYSATKVAGELIIRAAGNTHGLPFIIIRSCNNYGPRQMPTNLVPKAIKCLLENKKIPVYGEGLQIREWLHTYDNGNAILTILKEGKIGETYNVGTGHELKNIEVAKQICSLMNKSNDDIEFIKDPRPGHDFRYSINSTKLYNLGWKPVYKFADGLARTVDWYTNNPYYLNIK